MEVLKNFKLVEGQQWEEFPFIKILPGEDIFVGLPVCKVEFQAKLTQPVLIVLENQVPTAVDLGELKNRLAKTKRFFLVADEAGALKEVAQSEAKIVIRLPIETKVEELVFMNGQVLKQEKEEK